MSDVLLRFIHLTDTHITADSSRGHPAQPWPPLAGAQRLIDAVKKLPFTPDFILHTGDVVYDPDEGDYRLARDLLAGLPAPVYYLPGNHDDPAMLQRVLIEREPTPTYDHEFEINGVQIVCLDSNRAADGPHTVVTEAQLAWLRARCPAEDLRPLIVATHHNVLPSGMPWLDDFMGMRNGEDLHAALLPARDRLRGVFHGHVHLVGQRARDGITYFSAASSWMQFQCHPGQIETIPDPIARPGFNEVVVMRDGMYVRHHYFGV
ncbi:MAG: metallophosphoesterase [Anaerolineae bacterium]|nr:metallophosphoesterase [Anaerolineae bacterium]